MGRGDGCLNGGNLYSLKPPPKGDGLNYNLYNYKNTLDTCAALPEYPSSPMVCDHGGQGHPGRAYLKIYISTNYSVDSTKGTLYHIKLLVWVNYTMRTDYTGNA